MTPLVHEFRPISGVGVGLRSQHYQAILEQPPRVDWFETLTDNYLDCGGIVHHYLEKIRRDYPIIAHSVGMSIGSTDPIDFDYLKKIDAFARRYQPYLISDHLCWTSVGGHHLNELIPIPYNEEAIDHIADRISRIQDFLGRQIGIENVSSYLNYKSSTMHEWEFIGEILKKADCFMLCDVNNIFVSSVNHRFDANDFVAGIPADRIRYCHLAGFREQPADDRHGPYIIDAHNAPIDPRVWELYRAVIKKFGPLPTLIEWDADIPAYESLVAEADKARTIIRDYQRQAA